MRGLHGTLAVETGTIGARGRGRAGARVGDDDAPELREGGCWIGGAAAAGAHRPGREPGGLLNAKGLFADRFADAVRLKNPE
jgi:hypothetical protein